MAEAKDLDVECECTEFTSISKNKVQCNNEDCSKIFRIK